MRVGVCLKWVDLRPEIDPITGDVVDDERWFGLSPADQAALERALTLAIEPGDEVMALTAGPARAEAALRDALAVGVTRAVRVDTREAAASAVVAATLAPVLTTTDLVLCGEWSLDRGSGSVPAFVAHELNAAQALGCVRVERDGSRLVAERRLDRGRREQLSLSTPAVVSVEAGTAQLRRASIRGVLGADPARIEVVPAADVEEARVRTIGRGPYRPRGRELTPPEGADARERILSLTGARSDGAAPRRLELEADEAADLILDQLSEWGVGRAGEAP